MSRAFCIPGVIFLVCALVLNFLVSISLPYLPALDITRVHFPTSVSQSGTTGVQELRLGIWAPCSYNSAGDRTCSKTGYGYSFSISSSGSSQTATIHSSWTSGLAVHPVATIVTLIALLFSLSTHLTMTLIASLLSFLAATLTLIAFAIDIALYGLVKSEMNDFGVGARTKTAPAFWMTFVALLMLLFAGCTVCFGRRKARGTGRTTTTTKPGFFSRFRRS